MKRLFATPSAIASNAKSEWIRLYAKISKRKIKSERNRVLSSAPNEKGEVKSFPFRLVIRDKKQDLADETMAVLIDYVNFL